MFELRGPEGQVIADELHDGGGILVVLLLDLLDVSNGVVEGLLGELASLLGIVADFIIENGEVEGQSESDGVGGLEVRSGNLLRVVVGIEGIVGGSLVLGVGGVLSNVSVVVASHLLVEDQGLGVVLGGRNELLVQEPDDLVADFVKLSLNLLLVFSEQADVGGSLGFLLGLDGRENAPGGSASSDGVFVGNAEKVALFNVKLVVTPDDFLHVLEHVVEALSLFANAGHVDVCLSAVSH